mmetsp:Transcript_8196/g.12054  ORF Transcript_8196/g.12054 Transcript_8196/m.12054 type:complete len:382 (+) Transcript_8196:86-1231(+)
MPSIAIKSLHTPRVLPLSIVLLLFFFTSKVDAIRRSCGLTSVTRAAFYKSKPQIHSSSRISTRRKSGYGGGAQSVEWIDPEYKSLLGNNNNDDEDEEFFENKSKTKLCSATGGGLATNLLRGAFLRVASDISGGTPLESVKCRVTTTLKGPLQATRDIYSEGGLQAFWTGTPSRTIEGALLGAMFLVGSAATKNQVLAMGGSKDLAALAGGLVGGLVQAIVMTPAGMVFTSLNYNKGKPGYEDDNFITVANRIVKEKGVMGMFIGGGPMAIRQASNWASRGLFTEIARTNFKMSKYGLIGEIGSGVIGGVGSCWNTPIETVRVIMQRDVSSGLAPKTAKEYMNSIYEEQGIPGLFRGVTPRAIQAIWQTCFMVVVPNILGL